MPDYWKVILVRNEVCSLKGILSSPVGINFFPHWRKQKRFHKQILCRVWFLIQRFLILCLWKWKLWSQGPLQTIARFSKGACFVFSSTCAVKVLLLSLSASIVHLSLFGRNLQCWICPFVPWCWEEMCLSLCPAAAGPAFGTCTTFRFGISISLRCSSKSRFYWEWFSVPWSAHKWAHRQFAATELVACAINGKLSV